MTFSIGLRDFGRPINVPPAPPRRAPEDVARRTSIRGELVAGFLALVALFGIGGVWATTAELSGAIIAPGVLVVESSTKKIQHPSGGIVRQVLVDNGARVEAGAVLIRLDDTLARANLSIVSKNLDELTLRQLRLTAEREGMTELTVPAAMQARARTDRDYAALLAGEVRVFDLRATARRGKRDQIGKRIDQAREMVAALELQIAAKHRESDLLKVEFDTLSDLFRKNLVGLQRINTLNRDSMRVTGELAQLGGSKAETESKIAEYELAIIQIDQDLRSEVAGELRDVQAKIKEYTERQVAAVDALEKMELRAPQRGIVQQSTVHTPGSVISANEVVMSIVPVEDRLFVDTQVSPGEIDQIRLDQPVSLKFPGLNTRTSGAVEGHVVNISADRAVDPRDSRIAYYQVRVGLGTDAGSAVTDQKLVPGMPVETYFLTESRSFLSYLLKPLTEQMSRAFRER